MLHLGIAAVCVASAATGYTLGKRVTDDMVKKKLIEITKPRSFRKITNKEETCLDNLNDKEFASSGGFLCDIRKFDNTKLNHVEKTEEKKQDERTLILNNIRKFDRSSLVQVKENAKMELSMRSTIIQQIKYPNKKLRQVSREIKTEKVEPQDNFLVQIRSRPLLNKVNPLLINIQNEIARRQNKEKRENTFLTDIRTKNYTLKNIEETNMKILSDIDAALDDLLRDINPNVEIISLSSSGSETNSEDDSELKETKETEEIENDEPRTQDNSSSYDELEIVEVVPSYNDLEIRSETDIAMSDYLVNFSNYHIRHANATKFRVHDLRVHSY